MATDGDEGRQAIDALYQRAYDELTRMAASCLKKDPFATLSPSTLLHETWLKFAKSGPMTIVDEKHLKNIMFKAMYQVLVDTARRRRSRKRGAPLVSLDHLDRSVAESITVGDVSFETIIALDDAIEHLEKLDALQASIVKARFISDWTFQEIADVHGISEATVRRNWVVARAFLTTLLKDVQS
jgi:RNA polymerase sigma factor (TIGR02999 family)